MAKPSKAVRVIHWIAARRCSRKDSKVDVVVHKCGETTITETAEAIWPQNVTCKQCRRELQQRR